MPGDGLLFKKCLQKRPLPGSSMNFSSGEGPHFKVNGSACQALRYLFEQREIGRTGKKKLTPGLLFLSTTFFMAVKISGHLCASSIVRSSPQLTNRSGSDLAAES